MSRPFRVRVAETVRRHIVVEDGVECGLDLLQILPCEEQTQILAEELERRGFTVTGDVARRTSENGVELEVSLEEQRVSIKKRRERDVEHTEARILASLTPEATEAQREEVRQQADRSIEGKREADRRALTAELERELGDLRAELDDISVKVTQEALRRKASRMGEVESISEDPETGSMTIRIRV
ncbi:MAG: hypothetical protein HOV80_17885 [Polyangiaceae bacterium]|nr:hypothetical protein [Polyangiaceae bacterium]